MFGLYGLAQGAEDTKDYSLHFDLTVPLSRYVIDHEGELAFPFKRYQIQKVRRGERSQKGRFKEFYQCDVDVIDKNLSTAYDAEVVYILYTTVEKIFQQLGLDKKFVIQLNNRKLYDAIFGHLGVEAEQAKKLMNVFDLYHKIEKTEFEKQVKEIIGEKHETLIQYLDNNILTENTEYPENISKAVQELKEVYEYLQRRGVNVKFDPYIVRGLDYYNGTVFETFIEDNRDFGSICSGGRFDNLVGYIRNNTEKKGAEYGGVGGSIGLSRLLFRLKEAGLLPAENSLADVMIFNFDDNAQQYREEIADILRESGLRVDQYLNNDKMGKQFQYAESKKIPYGVFAGEKEQEQKQVQIKNLQNRQTEILNLSDLPNKIQTCLKLFYNLILPP
ncbi:MAG: histidine--tRNA ligase [Candidatus Peribacteria bacterium]|nr:histidine--tRNA ligase [Candidatus Peribacteria bacterium]